MDLVKNVNWISGHLSNSAIRCKMKVRYRQQEQSAMVYLIREDTARIVFEKLKNRPASGQAAVFYDGDTVLGGGIIQKVI